MYPVLLIVMEQPKNKSAHLISFCDHWTCISPNFIVQFIPLQIFYYALKYVLRLQMVLAGQKPEVIMEICSRAMAFWTYQVNMDSLLEKNSDVAFSIPFTYSKLHCKCKCLRKPDRIGPDSNMHEK